MATSLVSLATKSYGPFPAISPFVSPASTVDATSSTIAVTFANISQEDLTNPANSISITMQALLGGVWQDQAIMNWQGGPATDKNGNPIGTAVAPSMVFTVSGLNNEQVRAELTLPSAMTLSLTVTEQ